MRQTRWLVLATMVTVLVGSSASHAGAQTFVSPPGLPTGLLIDCDAGQRIGNSMSYWLLYIKGTCNSEPLGYVVIGRTQTVTLDGRWAGVADPSRGTIIGATADTAAIYVTGGNATIRYLNISGPGGGIQVTDGAAATIEGNVIEDSGREGITVNRIATARIVGNVIRHNGTDGIFISENANARIGFLYDPTPRPNTIQSNIGAGIRVSRNSNARIAGNLVRNNGSDGIRIHRGSQAEISSNEISGNGRAGIMVLENSGVNLGSDAGDGLFDAPNSTVTQNSTFGVACYIGGYVNGRVGSLTGAFRQADFGKECVNSLLEKHADKKAKD